ncbi:MAG: hypothetical protein JWM34_1603 [Ilumatobacteraceae bacterium]|nr:hypothetical protein [Ilumatobacteraceae bacterium]
MSGTPHPDPQPEGDPYSEPANSTVDDWHGEEVQADIDAAEKAMVEAGGDTAKAEQLFDQERPEHPSEEFKVDEDDRPS